MHIRPCPLSSSLKVPACKPGQGGGLIPSFALTSLVPGRVFRLCVDRGLSPGDMLMEAWCSDSSGAEFRGGGRGQ